MTPIRVTRQLTRQLATLRFAAPVTHVYNPLQYAQMAHEQYLRRYGANPREVVLLGMNPGPWGMAQTGVPFGEVNSVRDWLGIDGAVTKPKTEHPKRPIQGFDCPRSEVSGARLWNWAQAAFGTADRFFDQFMVLNYCPLAFMETSGKNRTPDKLPAEERAELFAICDKALQRLVKHYQPELVVGIGAFAEQRAKEALGKGPFKFGRILHPSPASPIANRGWAPRAEEQLRALGIDF